MTQPLERRIVTEQSLVDGTARDVLNGVAVPLVQSAWPHVMGAAALAEELSQTITLPATISATTTVPVGIALGGCELTAAAFAFASSAPASSTDYWAISLNRVRSGVSTQVARKTTAPSGEAITALGGWTFDTVAFTDATFAKGDVVTATFTKTGAAPDLAGGIASLSLVPADVTLPVVLFTDDFTRAAAGDPLGAPWSDLASVWTCTSGIARASAVGVALVETTASDVTVTARITNLNAGLSFRYVDADNHWGLSSSQVFRRVGGTLTNMGSFAFAAGDTVRIKAVGDVIECYLDAGSTGDFTLVRTVTHSAHQTATQHGIRTAAATAAAGVDWITVLTA